MGSDYSNTMNLPKTDFPMRANLPQREPEILKEWESLDIYNRQLESNRGKPSFILHDGPPYANGGIHLGTSLNKILKDIIIKYYSMNGYFTPYVPGWDTHGLPTEQRAIKELGLNRHEAGAVVFRRACREFAMKYLNVQRNAFKRLGVRGDWDNPYITLLPEFEAKQIEVFGEMARKGYIYRGLRPVYWCADCETALAEAEIEYQEDKTTSIYVKFPVVKDNGVLKERLGTLDNIFFVIWTTTTWTLPGNMAVCLNAEFDYSAVSTSGGTYIIATKLVEQVMNTAGISDYKIIAGFKGDELEGVVCRYPFLERDSLVILGDHVTLEAGTGCVHTAPGHGAEDFEVCTHYNIEIIAPIDDKGHLTKEAGMFSGLFFEKANKVIHEHLDNEGYLLASEDIVHQYPHCWRCKKPIIYRATKQWFVSLDGFRSDALEAIKTVKWIPEWGEERISGMVKERHDWCISRQRIWGVPLPIFYCKSCGKELINEKTIEAVKNLFKEKGSDAWFETEAGDILGDAAVCSCGGTEFIKENDIMDVWFDSGSSHAAVLETRENLRWPADMYLEGNDQHRGWFQSSLMTSVAARGKAPYKSVLTHGYVVDGEGKKMSKSMGNGIDPEDVIKEYGADILRLWAASSDYKVDIRISTDMLKQLSEAYRKVRNTCRFILSNIYDFDPDKDMVPYEKLKEIDRWALLKLNELIEKVNQAFAEYEFHTMFHSTHNFCIVDMSNFYLDIIKDRLYTTKADSEGRRAAQSVMFQILEVLVRLLTPVLAYTSEEIWKYMPHRKEDDVVSVQMNSWPKIEPKYSDSSLNEKWDKIIRLREDVSKALEIARADKKIGSSLVAKVTIFADGENHAFLDKILGELPEIFIVSDVELQTADKADKTQAMYTCENFSGVDILITQAPGEKCERCWMFSETVGSDEKHPDICHRCAEVLSEN